jgi:hypothetical protein
MRKRFRRALAFPFLGLLAVSLAAEPAAAQSGYCATYDLPPRFGTAAWVGPMTYQVRDVGGTKVLIVQGTIENGEAARLAQALASAGVVEEVWLNSPGGTLTEGIAMGRLLRKKGLLTRVPNGAACASACTFAFLGGPIRIIDSDAYYGVHMFSNFFDHKNVSNFATAVTNLARSGQAEELRRQLMLFEQSQAQLAADCAKFLIEMSASLDFLTGTFGQPQTGMCYLSREGMTRYNVTNAT